MHETQESDGEKVLQILEWIVQGEAALEGLRHARQQALSNYLLIHGPVLPDGRRIEPGRGGSYRVVSRRR